MKKTGLYILLLCCSISLSMKSQYAVAGQPIGIYTDIVPDTSLNYSGQTYQIDFGQDGIPDIEFNIFHSISPGGGWFFTKVNSLNSSVRLAYGSTDSTYVTFFNTWHTCGVLKPYSEFDTIRADNFLGVSSGYLSEYYYTAGTQATSEEWRTYGDLYIGVSLTDGVQTVYGWIRVDVTDYDFCTVRDYSIPSLAITGMKNNEKMSVIRSVYPNPASGKLSVSLQQSVNAASVCINDIEGRTVYTASAQNTPLLTIDVNDLDPGVYFLSLTTEQGKSCKKIIVNR
jgi:hypothetical protein